ncbi:hypothetical protein [Nitrosopumilus sp.]|uniref:hypothetical protein n=1 Tax=Nitrosopumilus sp. TaxID=2024843 RepID=UPI0029304C5B|nr:hypothetical protein [Nitrosopumilus sp.]
MSSLKHGLTKCDRLDLRFPISLRDVFKKINKNSNILSVKELTTIVNDRSTIQSFKADKPHVALNEIVTLRWNIKNCNKCKIQIVGRIRKNGNVVEIGNNLASSGSIPVTSEISTGITYTIKTLNFCNPQKQDVEVSFINKGSGSNFGEISGKGIRIFNGSSKELHIWMSETSKDNSIPEFKEIATLDKTEAFDQQFDDKHFYRFVAVDPLRNGCSGNIPDSIPCIHEEIPKFTEIFVGNSKRETRFWNIT